MRGPGLQGLHDLVVQVLLSQLPVALFRTEQGWEGNDHFCDRKGGTPKTMLLIEGGFDSLVSQKWGETLDPTTLGQNPSC